MLIDLKELIRRGKTFSEFYFEYTPEERLIDIPNAKLCVPIRICGEVELTGDHSASVGGEISFAIDGECTRCLKQVTKELVVEFDENCGEDEQGYPVVNDKIDLRKIIDDTIIMNIPITLLCGEDCKGICSGCGVNLNDAQCKCK